MKNISFLTILITGSLLLFASCDREPVPPPEPVIEYMTIEKLRKMFDDGVSTIDTNVYIQGIITLTPELGNLPAFVAYIQDSTAGICLTVTGTNTFSRDSEVKILCRGVSFTLYNGLLQFGDINIAEQATLISLTPPSVTPETVTIADVLEGKHQAEFVRIENVQYDEPGTYSGENIITDCVDELEVYTRTDATFASETLPAGNGYIAGVASDYNGVQLLLRDETEQGLTGDRCGAAGTAYLSTYKGGQVWIAWVYTGADPSGTDSDDTTTWEVDNVLVAEK